MQTGWVKTGGKWYYLNSSGAMQTGWVKVSGKWYYLNSSGAMQTGWEEVDKTWYYLNSSGVMQTGWLKTGGKWYYLNSSGAMQTGWEKVSGKWYYLNSSGAMQTGWEEVDGTWYYMNSSGVMLTGWQKVSGKWYYMDSSGAMKTGWVKVSGKWYYLNSSGAMQTGWEEVDGIWYYLNSSGAMQTGWEKISGKWYYLNGSGEMLTGWQKISGKWYYLNSSGAMQTGWEKVDGEWYYLNSSGAMQANCWIGDYYVESDGAMATNKWIGSYYVGSDGKWIRNFWDIPIGGNDPSQGLEEPKYSYEVYYIDGLGDTWYNGYSRTMYVKTDNPNAEFYLKAEDSQTTQTALQEGEFIDVDDQGWSDNCLRVPGGYIAQFSFETSRTGNTTITLYEQGDYDYVQAMTFDAVFVDSKKAQEDWADEAIAKYGSGISDPLKKLQAVCQGLLNEFDYSYNNPETDQYVHFASKPESPYFISKRWNSFVSPAALCIVAECIGGFDKIENAYYEFSRDDPDWMMYHSCVKVTYEGETYYESACPLADTGYVDVSEVQKIDFDNLSDSIFDAA